MISAASGSYAASLISLFSRQQSQSDDTKDPIKTAQRPPPPPPPLSSDGSTQSVLASLLQALAGQEQDSGSATLATAQSASSQDLSSALAGLLDAMDTNKDGSLSSTEISSALGALAQGETASGAPPPPPPRADASSGEVFGVSVKSLYQSLFEALTAGDNATAAAGSTTTAVQKATDAMTSAG